MRCSRRTSMKHILAYSICTMLLLLSSCTRLSPQTANDPLKESVQPLLPTIPTFTPKPPTPAPPTPTAMPTLAILPIAMEQTALALEAQPSITALDVTASTNVSSTVARAPLTLATPTPVPAFALQPLNVSTLGGLQQIRQIGHGRAILAAIAPSGNLLAVATTVGIAWFELPSLKHLRLDPIPEAQNGITFSPDGHIIATVTGNDATGQFSTTLWHSSDGTQYATLMGRNPIFSPDGQTIVTTMENDATSTYTTWLWRTSDGTQLAAREGTSPIFSPDGKKLALVQKKALTDQSTTWLGSTIDGSRIAMLEGSNPVFNPDGQIVATVQQNKDTGHVSTILWLALDGSLLRDLHGGTPAFSPDGRWLATTTNMEVQLWGVREQLEPFHVQEFEAEQQIESLTFSPDGQQLRGVIGNKVLVWNIVENRIMGSFAASGIYGTSKEVLVNFTSRSQSTLSGIRLVRTANGNTIYENADMTFRDFIENNERLIVNVNEDTMTAAIVTIEGMIHLINLHNGTTMNLALPDYASIAISPNGQTLAAASNGPTIELWRVESGGMQQRLIASGSSSHNREPRRIRYTPDGQTLIAEEHIWQQGTTASVGVTAWDMQMSSVGNQVWNQVLYQGHLHAWAYNPVSHAAAWEDEANYVQFRRNDGSVLTLAEPGTYTDIEFNPDSSILAIGSQNGSIQLIKTDSGYLYDTLQAGSAIGALAFSSDGTLLAAARTNGMLSVWRIGQQAPIALFSDSPNKRIFFTANNQMLVAGGAGGVVFYRIGDGAVLYRLNVAAQDVALDPGQRLLAVLHNGLITLWGAP